MSINTNEEQLLKKLAAAMSADPRGNTGALAEAAGISRATFNRFCGSREHLMEMIAERAEASLREIIQMAQDEVTEYPAMLSALAEAHFSNQEYLVFSCSAQSSLDNDYWESYLHALDDFFLGGQKAGAFKLDTPSQMLTELFVSMICGMIDAEHRGRVAASGLGNQMTAFFLNGAAK
jgi:TetR/AcrR family transcriptional repressor of mexCD-oprJ operon